MPSNIAEQLRPLARPIDSLTLLPGNPRRGDIDAVARSYERFGQRKPIVARADGTVIAGNHQLQAAQRLGWDEIAVVVVDDDDLTAKAFALADNRTGDLGTYDEAMLQALIDEVAEDPDLLAATSFDADAFLSGLGLPDLEGEEEEPEDQGSLLSILDVSMGEPKTEVTKGEAWLIDGKHWLLINDLHAEHSTWRPYLERKTDAIFLPYPEPTITLSPAAATMTFVMVQPNLYLAGHLLDRHIEARGIHSVALQ